MLSHVQGDAALRCQRRDGDDESEAHYSVGGLVAHRFQVLESSHRLESSPQEARTTAGKESITWLP